MKIYELKFPMYIDEITRFTDVINWNGYHIYTNGLNYVIYEKSADYINWEIASQYDVFDEDFIRKHKSYVNWDLVSRHQKLSEAFIIEFEYSVNWRSITSSQRLSLEFMINNMHRLSRFDLQFNRNIDEHIKSEFDTRYRDMSYYNTK